MFNKFKLALISITLATLFGCTTMTNKQQQKKSTQALYLKKDITQSELNNPKDYKRYYYVCKHAVTGERSSLTTYFPLSRESRKKENFGIYFQLNGGKAVPFDHIHNRELNARGTRFEVIYRSYYPIEGNTIELVARQHGSTYYKIYQGQRIAWLNCKGG